MDDKPEKYHEEYLYGEKDENYLRFHKDMSIKRMSAHNNVCLDCGNDLTEAIIYLPINDFYSLQVDGFYCENCNVLWVKYLRYIQQLLNGNEDDRGRKIQIEDKTYFCYPDQLRLQYLAISGIKKSRCDRIKKEKRITEVRKELEVIPSAVMKIAINYDNGISEDYFIVSRSINEKPASRILHYENNNAMELLTAAFVGERENRGALNGRVFSVKECITLKDDGFPQIAINSINIHSDGGFPSSIKNNHQQIVNVLLYSPYTRRLEKIRATLDKDKNRCFIDMFLFRQFVESYGNPGVSYKFSSGNSSYDSFNNLNAESILRSIGYTVNKNDNLSSNTRRELLRDIVDLEILSVHEVIDYLEFFIRSHTQTSNYEAREKWRSDIEYIKDYRADPQRFLIAK